MKPAEAAYDCGANGNVCIVDDVGDLAKSNPAGNGICTTSSGTCTLRAAIKTLNNIAGGTIHFNIGGGGQQTIAIGSALPSITTPMVIDGTTQPGFPGAPTYA